MIGMADGSTATHLAQSLAFQWPDFSSIDLSNLVSIPPNTHAKKKPFQVVLQQNGVFSDYEVEKF